MMLKLIGQLQQRWRLGRKYFMLSLSLAIVLMLVCGSFPISYNAAFHDSDSNTKLISKKEEIDSLREQIEEFSQQNNVEPIDAKVDKVWKAIPGYNGLRVDMEASLNKMKSKGKFDENKIIYKEISPKVHLEDLDPQPIYRGNPQKPMVTLLINVAWGTNLSHQF